MFKNKFLISFFIIALAAVGYSLFHKNSEAKVAVVGNDKDAHGCIASAGYTFSSLKNECVRLFEVGVRMNPVDESVDQTTSAFVVFKNADDILQAELFIPNSATSTILIFESGAWADNDKKYTLTKLGQNLVLLNEGRVVIYEYDPNKQGK